MPELPEVETVRKTLETMLPGNSITAIKVLQPLVIKNKSAGEFAELLQGDSFQAIGRRGKYLIFRLESGLFMLVHLRMTGRLVVTAPQTIVAKHTHLIWELSSGRQLRFVDTRRFGTIYLLTAQELAEFHGLKKMGPEPLSEDFTLEYLRRQLGGRERNIKALLLDQSIIAGIGNIYADEILAASGISPWRTGDSINEQELFRLLHNIKGVLKEAVAHRGTTFRDYVDGSGNKGSHQLYLNVYQRAGEPCKKCGEPLLKEKVAGRGTYYCRNCQS